MRSIAVLLLAAIALPAYAQLDTVTVTATRFPEDARGLPASVTVVTAEDIRQSAARTLPEILAERVGITMQDLFGNNGASASIDLRGFGATGTQNTLVLVDGRRVNDPDLSGVHWGSIPLASVERIEILRGTGAVLYGDAATSGVVNIITRSPLEQGKSAELMGRAGPYKTLEGRLFGSWASGNFGINATLHADQSDGYRQNNRNDQRNGALNLRWEQGNAFAGVRLGIDHRDLQLPGARQIQPSTDLDEYNDDRRGAQTPLDSSSRAGERLGVTLGTRLGSAELNIGFDWRSREQHSYFDQGGFPIYREDFLDITSITPRIRIPVQFAGVRHRFTFGNDLHGWRYDSRRSNLPENIDQPVNTVRVDEDMLGFYAQDVIELGARTLLSLGWREERIKYDASDELDPTAPGADFATEAPPASATQRQRAWEAGIRHSFSARTALFARTQRSFRVVNADEIYESDETFSMQFQILRPQTARTYEIGTEIHLRQHMIRATVFQTDVDDEIHLDAFTTGTGNTNLPPSRRRGVELETAWQPVSSVALSVGYAYTDARFLEGVLPGGPFVIGTDIDIAGRNVPLVPRHKVNAGVLWRVMDGASVSASLTTLSRKFMDNDEPNTLGVQIPAFSVLDVKVARDFSWGRLSAAVNNLLDESYFTYGVRSQFTVDRYAVYPLPGRGFNVMAEFRL